MKPQVGIEAFAVALPRRYIELADLARARGIDPAKFTQGLGGLEMAVAEPGEDTAALAASAVAKLLTSRGVDSDSCLCSKDVEEVRTYHNHFQRRTAKRPCQTCPEAYFSEGAFSGASRCSYNLSATGPAPLEERSNDE